MSALRTRFTLIDAETENHLATFAREVQAGLTARPKRLACRYFYDAEGSQLFEAICELPEYYLTRAERSILEQRATEMAALFPEPVALVELGSGSASKTRLLIDAFLRRHGTLRYVPVDISRSVLEQSSLALLESYPSLEILALAAEYHDGLRYLRGESGRRTANGGQRTTGDGRAADGRWLMVGGERRAVGGGRTAAGVLAAAARAKLILWLGSNVGNLERDEAAAFLGLIRETMSASDRLLVGIDLRKERAILEPAYDDAQGVTAQFNLNLLARINRELRGHFDLGAFAHRAVYAEEPGRIEMYLVSRWAQRIPIDHLGVEIPFAAGEAIHTENSYKYSSWEIDALAAAAGLSVERQWLDAERRFSVNLFAPA